MGHQTRWRALVVTEGGAGDVPEFLYTPKGETTGCHRHTRSTTTQAEPSAEWNGRGASRSCSEGCGDDQGYDHFGARMMPMGLGCPAGRWDTSMGEHESNSGRVSLQDAAAFEAARDILNDLIGIATAEIHAAREVDPPDAERVAGWQRRSAGWAGRLQGLRAGDAPAIRAVLDEAGPELRALITTE